MAYAKKTSKANEAFQKLKNDLAAGTAGNAYIFYGEETYLREYYLKELRKKLVPAGADEYTIIKTVHDAIISQTTYGLSSADNQNIAIYLAHVGALPPESRACWAACKMECSRGMFRLVWLRNCP